MTPSFLEKENANILRGLAIVSIMFHNFLHVAYGFTRENEMDFSEERFGNFIRAIDLHPFTILGEWFSFIGWVGVSVFIFFTGFGLGKKYSSYSQINAFQYLKHSYLKLFLLLFPAILFFVIPNMMRSEWHEVIKKFFFLTMLSNFNYPQLKIDPGVYWYFGLTFQFYVFFLLLRKYLKDRGLFLLSFFSIIILGYLGVSEMKYTLSIYKHCFIGWFPVFAIGVWLAANEDKDYQTNLITDVFCFTLSSVIVIIMNINYYMWLFIPIVGLIMFIFLTKIVMRFTQLAKICKWIGSYSAFIFVCHPMARAILRFFYGQNNLYIGLLFYICMTFLIAFCYKQYYIKINSIIKI